MANLLPNGKQQYLDNSGVPLVGGQLFTYIAGTTTPKATYQDAAATSNHTNPVILDARGEALIFWTGAYDTVLKDSLGNTIYSVTGVAPAPDYRTSANGSVVVPAGTTAQRDAPASVGYFRYNTDTGYFEGDYAAGWQSFQPLLVSGTTLKTLNGASLLGAGDIIIPATLKLSVRTANTIIAAGDLATFVNITSGTFSQTFTAAATLGNGFWFYLKNSGTGDITLDPNAAELIDGLGTYTMYPGECRLIQCDGTGFNSVVINSFRRRFDTSGSFVTPPGYVAFDIISVSGGGGGAGGCTAASGSLRFGGGGGGGGAKVLIRHSASVMGPSPTVLVGAGGTGGAAGVLGVNSGVGGSGGVGGFSYVSGNATPPLSMAISYGGGGGGSGSVGSICGGSGAGTGGAGTTYSGALPAGGLPSSVNNGSTTTFTNNLGGGGGGVSITVAGGHAEYGGGAGGSNLAAGGASTLYAGASIYAGAGGGYGATLNTSNASVGSSSGGGTGQYNNSGTGGGSGGVFGGSASTGGAGGMGSAEGTGGGGGGSGSAGIGGNGGNGMPGGGGGGGGGGGTNPANGGTGGTGGAGYVTIAGVI